MTIADEGSGGGSSGTGSSAAAQEQANPPGTAPVARLRSLMLALMIYQPGGLALLQQLQAIGQLHLLC
jgi:hypothetical protein